MGSTNGEAANGVNHPLNWEPLLEVPALTRRKLKIICVGAGYSGLTLAHKIQHERNLESVIDLQIYEKNADVGGTWYENTYPGAAW
jgi:cation diffusion facilitator CzcD-associated flavoprotein CzcO